MYRKTNTIIQSQLLIFCSSTKLVPRKLSSLIFQGHTKVSPTKNTLVLIKLTATGYFFLFTFSFLTSGSSFVSNKPQTKNRGDIHVSWCDKFVASKAPNLENVEPDSQNLIESSRFNFIYPSIKLALPFFSIRL